MTRRLWRCRSQDCPVRHGSVLGRLTAEGGLILHPGVTGFRIYLDSKRLSITCPACGAPRDFRGTAVISD